MTYHRITWHPEVTPYNCAICDDCGALIPVGDQETHDAREAKINALLAARDVPDEPKPSRTRTKKEEADVPGNGA